MYTRVDNMEKDIDEVYCTSCGEIIKSEAEICPKCGVRQKNNIVSANQLEEYDLKKLASKSGASAILLGFLISPLGYVYIGKWSLAIINFLTLNYLFMGPIIVPIHTYSIISDARKKLNAQGIEY